MIATRRVWLAAALWAVLAGCSSGPATAPAQHVTAPAEVRELLAPTGRLRVGLYPGSPTSLVRTPGGDEMRGVTVDIGQEMARRLGVAVQYITYPRVAEVVAAVQAGEADVTITNATPARAALVTFTAPLLALELGYLALPGSKVNTLEAVDKPGVRIGVSQGSSSQATLGGLYRHATLVPAPNLQAAAQLLRSGQIDAFATNKAILFELADGLPEARVLPGRWGMEHLALATPKGRERAGPWMARFARDMAEQGHVTRAAERAGLRGSVPPEAP
jgi:polar amino acid transport system substrate-binding protein